MKDAPSHLLLSALTWIGRPTVWTAGDEDEHIGTYEEAASARLIKGKINTELEAVEYIPTNPIVFQYTRHAHVGTTSSEVTYYGGVFGSNMPPVLRICLPDRQPWPERFQRSYLDEDIKRSRSGPPFEFYNVDLNGETGLEPDCLDGLTFAPDLPGQPDDGLGPVEDEGDEVDSAVGLGWQGTWVTALLEKQDKRQPLGERNEIVWHPKTINAWWRRPEDQEAAPAITWGVEFSLRFRQPLKITEFSSHIYKDADESVPSRGISSYTVRATILRTFVKNKWFVQANNLDGKNEDEDEGTESGGDSEDDDEDMDSGYGY
ncbi:hypothetical protein MSAN_01339900 [Mycena sanguinolenta]|uniref:Uncharacterized protein n=1 Tax=Mycena sanguinolenta TaxID=230812 RepID=A0A8H6YFQ5_9AGAR|nr:hypothetical protein MSAN_01339900 [Mycena sanguinolenta]